MGDQSRHDEVVRHIAATRFPFPNQQDWPADYVTLVNAGTRTRGVATALGEVHPDIVIVDRGGEVREMGEVETDVAPGLAEKWQAYSAAVPIHPDTGVRHFFVYVPAGQEEAARAMLEAHAISYAGLRAYRFEQDGTIRIIPHTTPGAAQDHRE
jgi:hypothetical protein